MEWHLANFILSFLTFIALVVYASFTYKIARENYIPLISITIKQGNKSHLNFYMWNHSKVEVETFCKIKANTNEGVFEFKTGFYGDKHPWMLPPLMSVVGNFNLKELVNEQGKTLEEFWKLGKIEHMRFTSYLKYRKAKGIRKWKKYLLQNWVYNFKTNAFWLDESPP